MYRCLLSFLGLILVFSSGCTDDRRGPLGGGDGGILVEGGTDPRCWDPGSIVPDITCGTPMPDVVCPGSCAQTLNGIEGVGLSSCRCMDPGNGFGGQWICDTTMCDEGTPDSGAPPDGGVADTGTPPDGAAPDAAAMCPPATVSPPAMPGCTTSQYNDIRRITSQFEFDAFATDPANAGCMSCLAQSSLACGTNNGCAPVAGEVFCCLEDTCGADDACRSRALENECRTQADGLNRCVAAIPICGLDPSNPPTECFP